MEFQKKSKVGVFGGSFDPLHFGHLNMAIALLEAHRLDHVLFCPAHTSPLKAGIPPVAAPKQRLAMVESGIRGITEFSLLDWEALRPPPSYTIDTIHRLRRQEETDLYLLLGEDQLADLHRWKDIEELLTLCQPLIAVRKTSCYAHLAPSLQQRITSGYTAVPLMEISSTNIRERLKKRQFCGHLVPRLVLDYIEREQLYL